MVNKFLNFKAVKSFLLLILAAANGNTEILKELILNKANLDLKNSNEETALFIGIL